MSELSNRELMLKKRLEEAEKNVILAAKYGKELLEQNLKLEEAMKSYHSKLDVLEQEKYSLKLKLGSSSKSLQNEIDSLRDELSSKLELVKRESRNEVENNKKSHEKHVKEYVLSIESLKNDLSSGEKLVETLQQQLRDSQEKFFNFNKSIHEDTINEETAGLQMQVATLSCENNELQASVSKYKCDLNKVNHKVSQFEKKVDELDKELESAKFQMTSYYNSLEKSKEEILELNMEIDNLRLSETDPSKKGNSLFSEIEDNRKFLEAKCQALKSKFDLMSKQNELKNQQMAKLKLQVASLLSLNSNKVDKDCLTVLEASVATYRKQVADLQQTNDQLEDRLAKKDKEDLSIKSSDSNDTDSLINFFKKRCEAKEKDLHELEHNFKTVSFSKIVLEDQVLELQRKLRDVEMCKGQLNAERIRMKVRIEELMVNKGIKEEVQEVKIVTEKLNFVKETKKLSPPKEESSLLIKNCKKFDSSYSKDSRVADESVDQTKLVSVENKENNVNESNCHLKLKVKKSVKMFETIDIKEEDGEVNKASLKTEAVPKPIKKNKVFKKMEVVKPEMEFDTAECKQQ